LRMAQELVSSVETTSQYQAGTHVSRRLMELA
jgi:hypothetical protein